jgi:hypothetical protein
MRIDFERSGGFAGISRTYSFSSDQMPAEEGRKVADLVEASGFFGLPPVIHATEPGADRFQYKITVESEQGSHTVQVDEGAVPSGLQPVISWMKNSAAAQAGN